jgi:hypothetical protein
VGRLARIQDNQILISAYDEILSQAFSYSRLTIGERPPVALSPSSRFMPRFMPVPVYASQTAPRFM